jgi:hypothetical protein
MFMLVGMIQFHGCACPANRPSPTDRIGVAGLAVEGPALLLPGKTAGSSTNRLLQRVRVILGVSAGVVIGVVAEGFVTDGVVGLVGQHAECTMFACVRV